MPEVRSLGKITTHCGKNHRAKVATLIGKRVVPMCAGWESYGLARLSSHSVWWVVFVAGMLPNFSWAQYAAWGVDAQAYAQGNISLFIETPALAFTNPARPAHFPFWSVYLSASRFYGVWELRWFQAGAFLPWRTGTWQTALFYAGSRYLHMGMAVVGYGHRVGEGLSLGVSAGTWYLSAGSYGRKWLPVVHMGFEGQWARWTVAGAIFNLTGTRLNPSTYTMLPMVMRAGIAYEPLSTTQIFCMVEKPWMEPVGIRVGLRFRFHPRAVIFLGGGDAPLQAGGGLSLIVWESAHAQEEGQPVDTLSVERAAVVRRHLQTTVALLYSPFLGGTVHGAIQFVGYRVRGKQEVRVH